MSQKNKSAFPLAGYDFDEAYTVRATMKNPDGLVDLEYGGFGIPLVRNDKIEPPSKTVPIAARIPSGTVEILPGPQRRWRIVGWIKIDPKYQKTFIKNRKTG